MPYGFDKEQVKLTEEGQRVYDYPQKQPGYSPTLTQKESAERLPNYDKLTRAERWVFEALPAVGESVTWVTDRMERSWLGKQALGAANWAGKALSVLDVGAEGVDRVSGLFTQLMAPHLYPEEYGDIKNTLADAWYAGSLFADTTSLPKFTGENEDGSWSGIQLPMAEDEHAQIRTLFATQQRIRDLVELEGYNRSDALIQARSEYYNSIGALAFRAQMHDTIAHIAGDPLNLILPHLSPIDAMHAKRATILSTKAAETVEDLGRWDRFIIGFTGGTTTSPSLVSKVPIVGRAFTVTPQSRALEYMSNVADNVDSYILSRFDDPLEMVETISRASKGSLGPEFGHAFVTLEGRTVQGVLSASDIKARELLGTWEMIAPHRNFLDDAADFMKAVEPDISQAKIVGYLADDAQRAGFLRRLEEAGFDMANTPKSILDDIAKFGDEVPYTTGQFKHYLKNAITDVAAQQAIVQFGVKSRGLILKMSYAMKSAETLAFLRLNPGFAVKNFVNNEFTMLARGVGGWVPAGAIDELVETLGFSPHRMSQAFTMAGDTSIEGAKVLGSSEKIIADALRGEPGYLGKAFDAFTDYANKIQVGPEIGGKRPFDMGYWASKAEQSASRRAFYNGYTQGWKRFWQPGKGFTQARDGLKLGYADEFLDNLDDVVGAAKSEKELDAFTRGGKRSGAAVMKEVERRIDTPLDDIMESVGVANLETKLTDAIEKGPAAIRRTMKETRDTASAHLDEVAQANHIARVEEITNVVQAGGPNGLLLKWGDAMDELAGDHLAHNFRMSLIEAPTREFANDFWEGVYKTSDETWGRTWGRLDETIEGIEKGAKNIGMEVPKGVKSGYRQIRDDTRKFFDARKKLRADFFAARDAGKTPLFTWEEINGQLDGLYDNLIETERIATQNIDDAVTEMVRANNPEMADAFATWRARAREMAIEDKRITQNFMKEVRGLSAAERKVVYNQFHTERFDRYVEMWKNERAGVAMMSGKPAAELGFDQFRPGFMPNDGAAQQLRQLGSQYGVVDKAGDPVFVKMKNIVNKYARGEYSDEIVEAAQQFTKIEEVPPYMVHDALEARRQWAIAQEAIPPPVPGPQRFEDITKQFSAKVDKFTSTPRHAIDPEVSNALMDEAHRMIAFVEEGTAGQRIFEEGKFARSFQSTYPDWYGEIAKKAGGKDAVIRALRKIIEDEGKDVGVTVERLKRIGMENLLSGPSADVRVLQAVGREAEAFEIIHKAAIAGTTDDLLGELGDDASRMYDWYIENYEKFTDEAGNFVSPDIDFSVGEIPGFGETVDDIAKELVDVTPPKPPDVPTVADPRIVTKDMDAMQPPYWAQDQNMMQSGWNALDEIESAALDNSVKPPVKWADMTAEQADEVERYLARVKGEMADSRYASIRYGEYKRDSALLNYNRRYNYNTYLGALAPFEFWTTQSMMKWAIHSIDRPAMFSNYLRMKKFITQAGAPNTGFPSRLQNSIRIPVPFMPDWMGNKGVYVDPLRFALPFDAFTSLPEQMVKEQHTVESRTERYIQEQIAAGKISSEDGLTAIEAKSGEVWKQAMAVTKNMDDDGQSDGFDFFNLFTSVHAPIQWAWKAATGKPEDIGPLLPLRRNIRQIQGMFGIGPADPKKGVWGNIRQSIGLPAFDQWDDYRIERMVSSMIATQQITPDMGARAMIEKEGEVWDMAAKQAAKEYAGGGVVGFLFKQLGIPTQVYAEGEMIQRSLQDDFSRAYEAYDGGNVDALKTFFDKHPEYESRLALWDKPEERMQKFLVDEIWSRYNEMPKIHKDQLKEHFGPMWQNLFLNKETRNTDNIPTDTLQVWLKLMGGDPPGTLSGPAVPIDFAPPEEAWRVQQFYDIRKTQFPEYYIMQDEYFKLEEGAARRGYDRYTELKAYWDWRNDFLHRNPDVAGYVTDDYEFKYKNVEEYRQAQQSQPQLTFNEWNVMLGPSTARVLVDGDIPIEAEDYLEDYAEQLGMTLDELIAAVANSQR